LVLALIGVNPRQACPASVFISVYPWLVSPNKNASHGWWEALAFIAAGDER
jgi:hypothetical protein